MAIFSGYGITLSFGADTSVGSVLNYLGFMDPTGGLMTDQYTWEIDMTTSGRIDITWSDDE